MGAVGSGSLVLWFCIASSVIQSFPTGHDHDIRYGSE